MLDALAIFIALLLVSPVGAIAIWICWIAAHVLLALVIGVSVSLNLVLAWFYWRLKRPRALRTADDEVHGDVPHVGRG